jgi:DNA-binding transcriptional LysR family regulator
MFDWDDLRYFLALHRSGSLVGAAKEVGADPTTVSRRVAILEKDLGTKLFVRGRDGWSLTPSGIRMLPAAQRAEDGALEVVRGVEELQEAPEGKVRLTTIEPLALWWMREVFEAVRERWPGIVVDLITTTRVLDLSRGEADIALRVGRPKEPGLLMRRLTTSVERPYAHRDWLQRHDVDPGRPDLAGHDLLTLSGDRWWEGDGRVLV